MDSGRNQLGRDEANNRIVDYLGIARVHASTNPRLDEPGKRSGAWVKYRVNRGRELVIGGYIPGPHGFDSLIVGYYQGKD